MLAAVEVRQKRFAEKMLKSAEKISNKKMFCTRSPHAMEPLRLGTSGTS
jgi:hypothetical protein